MNRVEDEHSRQKELSKKRQRKKWMMVKAVTIRCIEFSWVRVK